MKQLTFLLVFLSFFYADTMVAQSHDAVIEKIIVYGSSDCHYCIDTKAYLVDHKIAYVFYDIDTNEKALKEMLGKLKSAGISLSSVAIPVIDKAGEIFMNDGDFEEFLEKLNP